MFLINDKENTSPQDILIAVMGVPGAGKSTFISMLTSGVDEGDYGTVEEIRIQPTHNQCQRISERKVWGAFQGPISLLTHSRVRNLGAWQKAPGFMQGGHSHFEVQIGIR